MERSKKRVLSLLIVFIVAFTGIALYITYFEVFRSEALRSDPHNMRNWVDETKFGRGLFYDRNGTALMDREKAEDGTYSRTLLYPRLYAHIIGYNSSQYGRSALEFSENQTLLNIQSNNTITQLRNQILDTGVGNDVYLTIDHELQTKAAELMKGHKGAIVCMDVETGDILAMVSAPSYDAEDIDEEWADLVEAEDSPMYNRATQGLYAPGSSFKPFTGLMLLRKNINLSYEDQGEVMIGDYTFHNYDDNVYGKINLEEALQHSSNAYFADLSQKLNANDFNRMMEDVGMTDELDVQLPYNTSRVLLPEGVDAVKKASSAFGQGDLLVTPLSMCRAYAAIANGGRVLQPQLIAKKVSPSGGVLQERTVQVEKTIEDRAHIETLQQALQSVCEENGWFDHSFAVAGKTGTAENETPDAHAWFCGYAPAAQPKIAFAVVLEQEGETAARSAVPMAQDLLDWLEGQVEE